MNDFISFRPLDAGLPTYIRLVVTKKVFQSLGSNNLEPISALTALSACRTLLITKSKDGDAYEIFTAEGSYFCRRSDDNRSLLLTGYNANRLLTQNRAMKFGVCFQITKGIIVQIRLSEPYNCYFDIVNGRQTDTHSYSQYEVAASLELIHKKTVQAQSQEQSEKEEDYVPEEYHPERRLLNLLQIAESYSVLSSELEEQNAKLLGNVPYLSIEPVEYDRIDRVMYQFGVLDLNEDTFKVGVQVELEDKSQNRHAAEIVELVKSDSDAPATAIKLLFNEQIDISQFNKSGWFNLSFSTVNKDVQLSANEKIKNGEAAAKYMDTVLGKNSTAGFDNKDLSEVRARLQEKKYPPNESQMNAICAGINSRDVFLVMGPPGTGKTTVILEWVKYFVTKEHKRVLVSSQNNKAVDNVLARIADEKDIDIIRIGSESKLQSEVIPYMFENKVANLRRSIVENSAAKQNIIDKIVAVWQEFAVKVDETISHLSILKQHYLKYYQILQETLIPEYNSLENLLVHYRELQNNKGSLILTMNGLREKLIKHENSGAVAKFFTAPFYRNNIKKLNSVYEQYRMLKTDEYTTVSNYNALKLRYNADHEQIKNTVYLPLCSLRERLDTAFENIKSRPERHPEDIWDLFKNPRSLALNSTNDCPTLKQLISEAIQKSAELKAVLAEWKNETETSQNYALNEIVLESVDLVGATCIGINSQKRFANLQFDVTIIDEAGQIQVHNALVPMSVSNKLIMLGDHKQIPPTADQQLIELCEENGVKTELLEKSLFEKMYNELPDTNKIMLDTQYRMPSEIADTISEWFYDGRYYSPSFKSGLKSLIPQLSDKPYVIIDTSGESGRFEKKIEGAGSSNEMEAQIVADIIRHISENPENELKEIGVISAYKSQVKLIKSKIVKFLPKALVSEMVATLDSYQGQERDIILYSFTKSSSTSPQRRRIGFLNELRRLNVAMTRCKKMLVLIGDMEFLAGCEHCDKDEDGEPIYDKSERQFSDFIKKMTEDVRNGRGEIIKYGDFTFKMKGGDR